MFKLLIEKKAKATDAVEIGTTVLQLAVKNGWKDTVQLLLDKGANANLRTKSGMTPLHVAMEKGIKEICLMLIRKGANVNAREEKGFAPLHLAVRHGHTSIVRILLKFGANANLETALGVTPLHISAQNGREEIFWLLLENRGDVHAKDISGMTALHLAAGIGHVHIIDILLDSGADIDAVDKSKHTPFHLACKAEEIGAVIALIENGCDVSIMNTYGETGLDIARNKYLFYEPSNPDPDIPGLNIEMRMHPMFTVIKRCLIKMHIAGLANPKNLTITTNIYEQFQFKRKCRDEIRRMKETRLQNTSVTFYNILEKRKEEIVFYARNEDVVRALRPGNYEEQFPTYAAMIKNRFDKSVERKKLIDDCSRIYRSGFFTAGGMPHNCTEYILRHLSNKDLRILRIVCRNLASGNESEQEAL